MLWRINHQTWNNDVNNSIESIDWIKAFEWINNASSLCITIESWADIETIRWQIENAWISTDGLFICNPNMIFSPQTKSLSSYFQYQNGKFVQIPFNDIQCSNWLFSGIQSSYTPNILARGGGRRSDEVWSVISWNWKGNQSNPSNRTHRKAA